jgi:hypothetical protein
VVLADILLRDAVLGISRGMLGFHPVESLAQRCSLHLRMEGSEEISEDLGQDEGFWAILCNVWICADQPAVQELDGHEALVGLHRQLQLGDLPVRVCLDLGQYFPWASSVYARTGATGILQRDGELEVGVIARLACFEGPTVDGVHQYGFAGCPVRIQVQAGEAPAITLELGFPWGRMPQGVGGGRGVLLEDVRGMEGLKDFLNLNLIGYRAQWVLQHIDAGATAHGQAEVGFRERISRVWEKHPLDAADLVDALTDVLPNLALMRAEAKKSADEPLVLVLDQLIVDLVCQRKRRPAAVRGLVEQALEKGLAPHVDGNSGKVYWLPLGQFPEEFPAEALDSVVLGRLAADVLNQPSAGN